VRDSYLEYFCACARLHSCAKLHAPQIDCAVRPRRVTAARRTPLMHAAVIGQLSDRTSQVAISNARSQDAGADRRPGYGESRSAAHADGHLVARIGVQLRYLIIVLERPNANRPTMLLPSRNSDAGSGVGAGEAGAKSNVNPASAAKNPDAAAKNPEPPP